MYGRGICFEDNSQNSSNYAHPVSNKRGQLGERVDLPSGQYNLPPNKPGSQTERYDYYKPKISWLRFDGRV
jgi:hypothetical protein